MIYHRSGKRWVRGREKRKLKEEENWEGMGSGDLFFGGGWTGRGRKKKSLTHLINFAPHFWAVLHVRVLQYCPTGQAPPEICYYSDLVKLL